MHTRLFASFREAAGQSQFDLDCPDGASVRDALALIKEQLPNLPALERAMIAVNHEYVRPDHKLQAGDELALIPPVSGGAAEERSMFEIVREPIDPSRLIARVRTDADGAVDVFLGVARRWSHEREVVHLEYEAYPEMAVKKMRQIADEMRARWGIENIAMVHRVGKLEIGEASVCIAVASPHRAEAFAASQYAIDRLKQIVPIWKKEVWSDGSQWIGWEGQAEAVVSSGE